MSAGDVRAPLLAPVACPTCHHEHAAPLRITVNTGRRTAKEPAPPQLVRVCPASHALLILTFTPARERSGQAS